MLNSIGLSDVKWVLIVWGVGVPVKGVGGQLRVIRLSLLVCLVIIRSWGRERGGLGPWSGSAIQCGVVSNFRVGGVASLDAPNAACWK